MKFLLDPVLTATPSKCSTNIQFYTFVKYVLEELKREDVFFYWRIPNHLTGEEFNWYPKHPNIRYLPIKQHPVDRVQEYFRFSEELERDVDFWGTLWDYDVLITVRTPLVPMMKVHMNSPRHNGAPWQKEVWLIEEMPLFKFKGSVPVMDEEVQEQQVLQGYVAADKVWVMSYHEHIGINDAARKYLSPSIQKKVREKLTSVVPAVFKDFRLKTKEFFVPYEEKPFTIAFVGRMEKVQAQLDTVNEVMVKSWIQKGENVRLLACSVSKVVKSFDQNLVECVSPSREEFWDIIQKDVHLTIRLTKEGGFGMSLFEPIALGTPTILLDAEYVKAIYGPDYPFYISGPGQAAGMVEYFYRNYPTAYKKFMDWHKNVFQPMYKKRFEEDLLYPLMVKAMDDFKARVSVRWAEKYKDKDSNDIAQLIAQKVGERKEFVLLDVIKELGEDGTLDHLAKKADYEALKGLSLPWLPTWNEYRLIFKYLWGWEDASTITGHLKKKDAA